MGDYFEATKKTKPSGQIKDQTLYKVKSKLFFYIYFRVFFFNLTLIWVPFLFVTGTNFLKFDKII